MNDTTSAAPSERKSFETHAKERGYRLDRSTGGRYLYSQAAIAWRAWQAARTQPTPPAVVEPLTIQQIWASEEIMSANAMPMDDLLCIVRAVEAAHGIGIKNRPAIERWVKERNE